MKKLKATRDEIDPFDARRGGLRRLGRGGLGIYFGHLHANADIWATPDDRILVRFSHACYKHYFHIVLPRGASASTVNYDRLEDYIHDELFDWFDGARYDDF